MPTCNELCAWILKLLKHVFIHSTNIQLTTHWEREPVKWPGISTVKEKEKEDESLKFSYSLDEDTIRSLQYLEEIKSIKSTEEPYKPGPQTW